MEYSGASELEASKKYELNKKSQKSSLLLLLLFEKEFVQINSKFKKKLYNTSLFSKIDLKEFSLKIFLYLTVILLLLICKLLKNNFKNFSEETSLTSKRIRFLKKVKKLLTFLYK